MYVCVGTALLLESVPYRMFSLTCLNPQCGTALPASTATSLLVA
jgi:hypothetical protein